MFNILSNPIVEASSNHQIVLFDKAFREQRKGFKLRERLRSTIVAKNSLKRLDRIIEEKMVDLDDEQY